MVMSVVWTVLLAGSILCAAVTGRGQMLSAGVIQGAQAGVTLAISIAGSLCLWSGVGLSLIHISEPTRQNSPSRMPSSA